MNIQDLKSGNVKLEFGNSEHIACIDENERQERLKKLEEDDKALKEYEVEFAVSGSATLAIRAFNEEEAKEMAKKIIDYRPGEFSLHRLLYPQDSAA